MKNLKNFEEYVFEGSGDTCACGSSKKKKIKKLKSNKELNKKPTYTSGY